MAYLDDLVGSKGQRLSSLVAGVKLIQKEKFENEEVEQSSELREYRLRRLAKAQTKFESGPSLTSVPSIKVPE